MRPPIPSPPLVAPLGPLGSSASAAAPGEAELRLRAIVEASPVPLLLSRMQDGVILYANERLERLIGAPPGTLLGRHTPDFYDDPGDRPRVMAAIREEGRIHDLELRLRRLDGTLLWVSLSVQMLVYDGAEALATALVDVTERKRAEEALRSSEASYRCLFDSLEELVYIQDLDGRFLNVNRAVLRAYGYPKEAFVGQTPAFLAAPGTVDPEALAATFEQAVAGTPQRFDWWGRRRDGSVFPKEVVLKRATYFGQDVVIAVARDISERLDAEASLRRSEEHFRRMIENASDLISIIDAEGTVTYQSPAITHLLGYEQHALLGQNAFAYVHPDDVAPTQQRLAELAEQPGTPVTTEFRFRHRDGSWRHIEAVGTTLSPDDATAGIVVNSRDVTERRQAEATLRMQKTLLEAQGEASIDGIVVIDRDGAVLSCNQRFLDLWGLTGSDEHACRHQNALRRALRAQVLAPDAFDAHWVRLATCPDEVARDEVLLHDGRVFDRYSTPLRSHEGDDYGRIWFYRDITAQKRYAAELEAARREAEQAREETSRYAARMERQLELGRTIQRGLLPLALPQPDGWEVAVRFRPAWQVAGDFYDVFTLPSGRLAFLIADVSGKGVGAALFMALFQSLLRAAAERAGQGTTAEAPADEVVLLEAAGATNDYITRVHRHAHMFASVFFGLLDPASGTVRYVNAGHEPPIVLGAGRLDTRLRPTGPALGLMVGAPFEVGTLHLAPGETLLAYTDGVTEARDPGGHLFTEERLLALLAPDAARPPRSAPHLLDAIEVAVGRFEGDAASFDDLTLLALRRTSDVARKTSPSREGIARGFPLEG